MGAKLIIDQTKELVTVLMTKREECLQDFAIAVLDCGYADLELIQNIDYDWSDIIERLNEDGETLNLHNVLGIVFSMALADTQDMIEEGLNNLLDVLYEDKRGTKPIPKEERELIEQIVKMNLNIAEDVEIYYNYLDTHVNLYCNEDIYRDYFSEALNFFYQKTGHEIEY